MRSNPPDYRRRSSSSECRSRLLSSPTDTRARPAYWMAMSSARGGEEAKYVHQVLDDQVLASMIWSGCNLVQAHKAPPLESHHHKTSRTRTFCRQGGLWCRHDLDNLCRGAGDQPVRRLRG